MKKLDPPATEGLDRRQFLIAGTVLLAWPAVISAEDASLEDASPDQGARKMYGLIGKMKAVPGKRDELIAILVEGVSGMPGCLSYIVSRDLEDEDGLWVTEVWEDQEKHQASLELPSVQQAIKRGRPLIAGFEQRIELEPIGGHGLG